MVSCAAILAGGLGTRLRMVVNDRPKVMAPVAGRPFLTHLLDQLAQAGIAQVILCTGYLSRMVQEELGDSYRGMHLEYSVEDAPLGTGGALRHAAPLVSGDRLLVLNGDSFCHCDLADFAARQEQNGACSGMVLARVDDVGRFGAVQTGANSLVESFREKGGEAGPGWINAGIYLVPAPVVHEIDPGRQVSLEREILPELIARGIHGYRCTGAFIDIGIPEDFRRAQTFFSETRGQS